jgi:glycosyltransferase involved in cell wall biosynthesis
VKDQRIFWKECRSLASAGYDVHLVATGDAGDELCDGVHIHTVRKRSGRLARMTASVWDVYRRAIALKADLYHLHDPEMLSVAPLLRLRGAKVVFDMHELLPETVMSKHWIHPILRRLIRAVVNLAERLLLTGGNVVFAADVSVPRYPYVRRGVSVRNWARISEMPPPYKGQRRAAVTYIGAISHLRGSTVTIEALRRLWARGVMVGFDCIGPAGEPEDLDQIRSAAAEAIGEIFAPGAVPAEQVHKRIKDCAVGLSVLMPTGNYADTIPTKVCEYMALELPVIVSDFPILRRMISEAGCGLTVDPASPAALAEAINQILADPQAAARMGAAGRRYALDNFTWEAEAKRLTAFYQDIFAAT